MLYFNPQQQRLLLKLKKPKTNKKVQWDESAVDNEFMGKKTSKCKQFILKLLI